MRFLPAFSVTALALSVIFTASPNAKAAKKGELTDLAGNYDGSLVISGKSVSGEITGTGKLRVKVSTTGKKATIKLDASILNASGAEIPIDNEIKLTAGNRVKIKNAAPGASNDFAVKGKYKVRNGRVIMKFPFRDGPNKGKINSIIRVKIGTDTRSVDFDYNVSVAANGVEYDYVFTGAAK